MRIDWKMEFQMFSFLFKTTHYCRALTTANDTSSTKNIRVYMESNRTRLTAVKTNNKHKIYIKQATEDGKEEEEKITWIWTARNISQQQQFPTKTSNNASKKHKKKQQTEQICVYYEEKKSDFLPTAGFVRWCRCLCNYCSVATFFSFCLLRFLLVLDFIRFLVGRLLLLLYVVRCCFFFWRAFFGLYDNLIAYDINCFAVKRE